MNGLGAGQEPATTKFSRTTVLICTIVCGAVAAASIILLANTDEFIARSEYQNLVRLTCINAGLFCALAYQFVMWKSLLPRWNEKQTELASRKDWQRHVNLGKATIVVWLAACLIAVGNLVKIISSVWTMTI
jgi:hypothetical protein